MLAGVSDKCHCMDPEPPPWATHRLILCVYIEFVPEPPDNRHSALVVWLDRQGNNVRRSGVRPRPPKQRVIDLREGDQLLQDGRWRTVERIQAYRGFWLTDEQAATHGDDGGGYLYRLPVQMD